VDVGVTELLELAVPITGSGALRKLNRLVPPLTRLGLGANMDVELALDLGANVAVELNTGVAGTN